VVALHAIEPAKRRERLIERSIGLSSPSPGCVSLRVVGSQVRKIGGSECRVRSSYGLEWDSLSMPVSGSTARDLMHGVEKETEDGSEGRRSERKIRGGDVAVASRISGLLLLGPFLCGLLRCFLRRHWNSTPFQFTKFNRLSCLI
jgi:hypothetical protein